MNQTRTVGLLAVVAFCQPLMAGSLDVTVKDRNGAPVGDAVVYAQRTGASSSFVKAQTIIDQRDKQFVPYVTAVQLGTSIMFPNSDNIRHHVYSFSPAKKFELSLYSGVPAKPVVFDNVGFVTLGCNIHDWMIAYVAVLPTPHFQVTGENGRAMLKNLPAGNYTVQVWQPALKGVPENLAQQVELSTAGAKELLFALDLKPDFRAKRAPGLSTGGYR
ncbi:MAG TPA: methylamine utilization protein [Chthoniobacterales bacterium]|nr:methylamine utilization protein [Chthoniobacterales bacterium]